MTDLVIAHLWQSSWFAGVAWALTMVLRRNGAHVRYWIWFVASLKFLIPFALLVRAGSLIQWHSTAPEYQQSWIAAAERLSQPVLHFPASASPVAAAGIDNANHYMVAAVAVIWLGGFLVITALWLTRFARVRATRRAATPFDVGDCPIPVLSTAESIEPGVFGITKPVMLLPGEIVGHLTEPQLRAIVAHEVCHVRRGDNLTAAIHMCVQAIFWFHPLIWWMGARLLEERERACDEAVLLIGQKPRDYAEGILKVCRLFAQSPVPCVAGVSGSDLRKRIEQIMANRMALGLSLWKRLLLAAAASAALAAPIAVGILSATATHAQQQSDVNAADNPRFDAVSIHPSAPDARGGGFNIWPNRLEVKNQTLKDMVKFAYNLRDYQVSGASGWMDDDHYQIETTYPANTSNAGRLRMMQAMLAERFGLTVHHEPKEVSGYALVVAKNGPKLEKSTATDPRMSTNLGRSRSSGLRSLTATYAKMSDLAKLLSGLLILPVEDRTALDGVYDFKMEWQSDPTIDPGYPPRVDVPLAADQSGPTIFTALQQTLGLRLEKAKQSVDAIVIDHADKPTAN
jgi:uncharacterized protein (TIGR03435 family)